jgi:hypothetical protein
MIEKNWPRAIVITAVLALIVAFSGCGKKGDPLPPKEPLPRAIFDCRVAALNHW